MKTFLYIKKRQGLFLEVTCIEYILIMGLLYGYVGYNRIWLCLLLVLLSFLLMSKKRYRTELFCLFPKNIYCWLIVLLGCISVLLSSNNQYLFYNIKKLAEGIVIVCIIDLLSSNEDINIWGVLKSNFWVLNFFWIVNLIVTAIQCTGNGFLIKAKWLAANSLYKDHCAGLFGANGTHKLSFFVVFMLVYNLHIAEEVNEKSKKRVIYTYTLITMLWMLYLSTLNDNKTLFALIPAFFITFYVFRANSGRTVKEMLQKLTGFMKILVPIIVIMTVFLIYSPDVLRFIQEKVFQSALRLVTQGRQGRRGSIERITIAIDALKRGKGLLFGDGLGAAAFSEELSGNYQGYIHFSMSSIGSLTTLGGIGFFLAICMFYKDAFVGFLNHSRKSWVCNLVCFAMILGLTTYTPFFETVISVLWICLAFLSCCEERKRSVMRE